MKRKNLLLIASILIISIILSACEEKPEAMVDDYIKAMKNYNLEEMGEYIITDEEDTEEDNTDDEESEEDLDTDRIQEILDKYFKENAEKIEYEIKESNVDGDKGTVKVDFKYVDGTPIITKVLEELMEEVTVLAFSGSDISDEKMEEMTLSLLEQEMENEETRFVERTLDIPVKKVDKDWYISDVSDELLDVSMCNTVTLFTDIEGTDWDEEGEGDIVEKEIGDTFELETIKVTVNSIDEKEVLSGYFDEEIKPKDGAKFMVLDLNIENINKEELSLSPEGFTLIDDEEREFNVYDSFEIDEESFEYKELAPNIEENGVFIYEVPADASNFKLAMKHGGTEDLYLINLGK